MTDSNSAPNQTSSSSSDYEGSDPDLSDDKKDGSRLSVSTVQVGASAAAAVTSALAASFFGVAGTLIGAAVGSIVSTIAGSLYAHYLGRAGERIKVTKDVVIQRIPGEVLATTPLRHLTRPTDLPGQESLQAIGDEHGDESVAVPVEEANRLLQQPDGMAPLDQTSVLPTYGSSAADNALRATQASGRSGASTAGSNGAGTHGPAADRGTPPGQPERPATWWKKPALAMAAVSVAGFLIAIGVVLVTETAIGHPVSGGDSGNTISKIGGSDDSKSDVTPSEQATPTSTDAPSAEKSADASQDPVPPTDSTDPTATSGTDSTDQPTADSGDQGDQGDQGVAATEQGATQAP